MVICKNIEIVVLVEVIEVVEEVAIVGVIAKALAIALVIVMYKQYTLKNVLA